MPSDNWLDDLAEAVAKMTDADWEARGTCFCPAQIVRVYHDGMGRRCTDFVATLESAVLPNAANTDGIVALRNHADWLIRVARAVEAVSLAFPCVHSSGPQDCPMCSLRAALEEGR